MMMQPDDESEESTIDATSFQVYDIHVETLEEKKDAPSVQCMEIIASREEKLANRQGKKHKNRVGREDVQNARLKWKECAVLFAH